MPTVLDGPEQLYARWREIARLGGERVAVQEMATGRPVSFAQLAQLAEDAPVPALLQPAGDLPLAVNASAGLEFLLHTLAAWRAGLAVLPLEPGTKPPAAWLEAGSQLPPLPQNCAIVKLTSGSTGAPRGVAFTGSQIAADCAQLIHAMQLGPVNLGAISLAHSYGFSNLVTPLLLHGIPLVLAESPLPEGMRRALESSALAEPCILPAVPALWRAWFQAGLLADQAGGRILRGISAGAPLPMDLEREIFAQCGFQVHNFYGASECGGIAFYAECNPREFASLAGELIPGVQAAVTPEGLLQVRGPAVGTAYWPEPGPNLADGVYTAGDLVALQPDGLHIEGRAGDLIHIAGRKLMPQEVEGALRMHELVEEVLVFGIPSREATRQEEIVACLRTAPGRHSEAEFRAFLHRRLAGWKIPRHWWVTPELRPDARGKLSRDSWRKRFLHAFPREGL